MPFAAAKPACLAANRLHRPRKTLPQRESSSLRPETDFLPVKLSFSA
jgi:hypothetical protein